jgi:hypothetical protein
MKKMMGAAAVGVTVAVIGCGGAYLTAPPGSTVTVDANPKFIPAHSGVSELMAVVTEPAGTDVPDGTVVLWSTNLGHVDPETRTRHGIARNRLISDSRSGTARVNAVSGANASPPPTTTPSSTTTTITTSATTALTVRPPPIAAMTEGGFALLAGAQNSGFVDVTIGNALVERVQLRAVPSRITNSNSTHVIATVLDASGNPVANVPVYFEVVTDADTDFFESAGPIHTDNNGEAEAVLRTRRTLQGTIIVRAAAAGPGRFVPSEPLSISVS